MLFGPFYYAFKSMWGAAIISFLTLNGLGIIMPIMNENIVTNHYENIGFKVRKSATEKRKFFETPQGLLVLIISLCSLLAILSSAIILALIDGDGSGIVFVLVVAAIGIAIYAIVKNKAANPKRKFFETPLGFIVLFIGFCFLIAIILAIMTIDTFVGIILLVAVPIGIYIIARKKIGR